jgi:pimeloyl-[acyl-carrier protein] synthase
MTTLPAGDPTTTPPFPLYSERYFADPYPFYAWLRESDPVHWEEGIGTWILTRFDDVARVARQPAVFSSRLAELDTRPPGIPVRPDDVPVMRRINEIHRHEFIQKDPPEHTEKRACVYAPFSPKSLEPLRATVRAVIDELLDGVAAAGRMDVLDAVARPLPLLVISKVLGIPPADVAMIAEQAARRMAAVLTFAEDRMEVAAGGFRDTEEYLTAAFDERIAALEDRPALDVLDDIACAEAAGRWSRSESLANAMTLIDAGHETTIQLVCNGTLQLLGHRDQWETLCADPDGVAAGATEECLRYDPPLQALRRIVTEDVEVGGRTLHRGDRILAVVASANRDPARFADPDTFDVRRRPNPHLSFGSGPHFCLGQYLARLEGQEYLKALATRFPDARLEAPDRLEYHTTPVVRSLTAMPISLTPPTVRTVSTVRTAQ